MTILHPLFGGGREGWTVRQYIREVEEAVYEGGEGSGGQAELLLEQEDVASVVGGGGDEPFHHVGWGGGGWGMAGQGDGRVQ